MSLRHRPDRDKWEASFRIGGKRVRKLFAKKSDAQEFIRDARLRSLGLSGIDKPCSFEEAFANYLETESAQKGPASYQADKRFFTLCLHFFVKLRGLNLVTQAGVEDLQRFQLWAAEPQKYGDGRSKQAWSTTTVAHYMLKLRAVFNKLMITGQIKKNPTEHWKVPKGDSSRRRPMTQDEFFKLIAIAPSWFLPILRTLRLTGARGVALAELTWDRVNFTDSSLLLSSRKGGLSKMKLIPVPIFPELREILTKQWNARRNEISSHYVFCDEDGGPLTGRRISRFGHELIKQAGLKGVVLYGLRHSLATDLLEAGVSTEIIRRIMGHTDTKQLQTYTQFTSIKVLEEAISSVRGKDVTPDATESKKIPKKIKSFNELF